MLIRILQAVVLFAVAVAIAAPSFAFDMPALIVKKKAAAAGGGGGTDWTADASMKALYYFESSPGLMKDSKGTNHIQDNASAAGGPADTTNYTQGTQSGTCASYGVNDTAYVLAQANMSADFPCNGTGDGEITVAGWVRPTRVQTTGGYYANAGDKFRMFLNTGAVVTVLADGSTSVSVNSTTALTNNNWFFIAGVYDDASDNLCVYVRQQGAGSSEYTCATANIGTLDSLGAAPFVVGNRTDSTSDSACDGSLDAWSVFNGKAMSRSELDGIFINGWSGAGW